MNESSARTDILSAIRSNLSASSAIHPSHSKRESHGSDSAASGREGGKSLVDTFCENLKLVGGRPTVVNSAAEISRAIRSIFDELNPRRIAVSDSQLVRSYVASADARVEILETPAAEVLFACDIGITEAQFAIAETGTLVLESDREANRLTSLVPETHLCILRAENIRSMMSQVLGTLESRLSPVVTFITGPSRTSDIELTLVIGVHGPRDLYVNIIDD